MRNLDDTLRLLRRALEALPSVSVTRAFATPDKVIVEMAVGSPAALARLVNHSYWSNNRMDVGLQDDGDNEAQMQPESLRYRLSVDRAYDRNEPTPLECFGIYLIWDLEQQGHLATADADASLQHFGGGTCSDRRALLAERARRFETGEEET